MGENRAALASPLMAQSKNLGQLKRSGWRSRTVKEELRGHLIARLREGQPIFPGIVGYEQTVTPQIVNAILSGHDFILLGLRGQAKTRILRALTSLLDDEIPAVQGCEINDDPLKPVCVPCQRRLASEGDELAITWIPRADRYREKLATPDVTIADLIGDIDPIKAATRKLTFADPEVVHYGIIPRSNRGIFAINELPDLQARIQFGLLNILEEGDVQIRGFPIRLPLDICLVFSANPEDYTNRGRIITPLKDRFGSQIRTHYPLDAVIEMAVVEQEAVPFAVDGIRVDVPSFMSEIVAEISQVARRSPHVNQRSGVSVRLSIANYETLVANAVRRALRAGESEAAPRVCDLDALVSSTGGKLELETLEEGQDTTVIERIVRQALVDVFRARVEPGRFGEILKAFDEGLMADTGDDVVSARYMDLLTEVPGLKATVGALGVGEQPAVVASAVEFVLEGLHLLKRLNKDAVRGRATYRARG